VTILVTGGAGYIGSHVCVRLLEAGYDVLVVDDFSNCREDVIGRIATIAGRAPRVARVDVCDRRRLAQAVERERIDGAIHLAGRKAVGDSVRDPLAYFHANLTGTINVRAAVGACPFVYSSSATVYGTPTRFPIEEDAATLPANPYGYTKLVGEQMLRTASAAAAGSRLTLLRYFNPAGAHASGLIGDDPLGVPQNLMPRIERVAVGGAEPLVVYGTDYPTRDGTAIRDYVHVVDLADAHLRALESAAAADPVETFNLGSERGQTVLEVVHAFERATGNDVPWRPGPRRDGDVPELWASGAAARARLGWRPVRDLETICRDSLRWRRHWTEHLQLAAA
jgi:UDP-glucose 4-epimerase